jgi:UDP-N-acetylglucosamine 2-epimerase
VIYEEKDLFVIFTKANSDMDGRIINRMIDEFVGCHKDRCVSFTSLGQLKYLSALQYCKAVVGNSSSGIIEVPTFGIPTINIGSRQRRRMQAESVIHCKNDKDQIKAALKKALSDDFAKKAACVRNPYEGNQTSDQIIDIINQALWNGIEKKKEFYDVGGDK